MLGTLFNDRRLERMIEYPALAKTPADAYPLSEMLADVRAGVWTELSASRVAIDPFRRELQRSWFNLARNKLNPPPLVLAAGRTAGIGGGVRSRARDERCAVVVPVGAAGGGGECPRGDSSCREP